VNNLETKQFYVVGNNLALDFINSVMFEITAESLAAWAMAVGLINKENTGKLLANWRHENLSEIAEFRDKLRASVDKLSKTGSIDQADIDLTNNVLKQGGRFVELRRAANGFTKRLDLDLTDAKKITVPIAESFVDLLCYGNLDYLRKCENPQCVLYFYDTTKNHKRRWCSMAVCGNRAKANKFYQKKKIQKSA
jgi:predicted RNA-binding Zn ribbon-like protein